MAELSIRGVYKRYEGSKEYAVKNLSLETNDKEFISILGPSGCGKTTTMRMIAGLETITKGQIYIGGRLINDVPPRYRNVGLAFENYALYPPLTVYENLAFSLKAKGIKELEIEEKVKKIASLLRIEHILEKKPAQLVEGDMQRVNIGRALIREPDIILLDEPMSHLDGRTRQILRTEIKRLHNEIKATTVLVTHDQLEALSMADRVAIMNDGELQQFGTPKEVYNSPLNEFVAGFIGEPPMNLFKVEIIKEGNKKYFLFRENKLKIMVPEKYENILNDGEEVRLGIRPTDVFIVSEGSPITADIVENIGEEQRISTRVGSNEFLTFIVKRKYNVSQGDKIRIQLDPEKTHLFDLETGKNILINQKEEKVI